MRNKRFIAEHRGGVLTQKDHRLLVTWACACARHILPLMGEKPNAILIPALETADQWAQGKVLTGAAMKVAREVHAYARTLTDPVDIAVARAVGHAVATTHMADHCLGAAIYALKAVKHHGASIEKERGWQNTQLTEDIRGLVLSSRQTKERDK
ncbi:MAG: hypothetical protein K9N05_00915 [Candidatus Marinimicrobia bacterium]|nr:hypothetical protein [Candidatus Neomarinimicrobiota bacterium]